MLRRSRLRGLIRAERSRRLAHGRARWAAVLVATAVVAGLVVAGTAATRTSAASSQASGLAVAVGATVERRIQSGNDDAEESAGRKMSLNSSDLELVYDGSNQQVGLRFSGLAIPKQATITSAYVQFEVDETQSAAANLVCRRRPRTTPPHSRTRTATSRAAPARLHRRRGRRPPGHRWARSARHSARLICRR